MRSKLRFGDKQIASASGVQQGDPARPVSFAMALWMALKAFPQAGTSDVLDLWYADDGCLIGDEAAVLDAFRRLSDPLAAIGMTVNATKCRLWRNGTRNVASDPGVPSQIIEL